MSNLRNTCVMACLTVDTKKRQGNSVLKVLTRPQPNDQIVLTRYNRLHSQLPTEDTASFELIRL